MSYTLEHKMQQAIEMHQSLLISVLKAGGDPKCFITEELEKMTAMELILHLATNDIHFVWEKNKSK